MNINAPHPHNSQFKRSCCTKHEQHSCCMNNTRVARTTLVFASQTLVSPQTALHSQIFKLSILINGHPAFPPPSLHRNLPTVVPQNIVTCKPRPLQRLLNICWIVIWRKMSMFIYSLFRRAFEPPMNLSLWPQMPTSRMRTDLHSPPLRQDIPSIYLGGAWSA